MKIKHILIVSLILAIITIGAVSATEDTDALVLKDSTDEVIDSSADDVTLNEGEDEPIEPSGEKEISLTISNMPEKVKYGESVTVNVSVSNEDANGEFKYYLDEEDDEAYYDAYTVEGATNQEIEFDADGDFGKCILYVKYMNDMNYPDKVFEFPFIIEDWVWDIDGELDEDHTLGEDYELYVDLPYEAYGKVTATVGSFSKQITYTVEDEGYDVSITIPGSALEYGVNEVKLYYVPSSDSKFSEKTASFFINATTFEIMYDSVSEYLIYGDVFTVNLTLPANANGNLTLQLNGEKYRNVKLENGKAVIAIDDLPTGRNSFNAAYTGDDYEVESIIFGVDVAPKVSIPEYVYVNGGNYTITITLSDKNEGSLTIYRGYNLVYENGSAKGVVELSFAPESKGIEVQFNHMGFNFDKYYEVVAREQSPEIEMIVSLDEEKILKGHGVELEIELPDEVYPDGNFVLYIDDVKVLDDTSGYLYYETDSLPLGTHTWRVELSGDSYYTAEAKSGSFEVIYIDFYIPEELIINGETSPLVYANLPDDATGILTFLVDGKEYDSVFVDGYNTMIYLYDLAMGKYDVELKYEGNYPSASQKGQMTLDYEISASAYNDGDDFVVGQPIEVSVYAPYDASGDLTLSVEGKEFTGKLDEGYAKFVLTDLPEGEYVAYVAYLGDSKYPSKTCNASFTVEGYDILVPEQMYCGDDEYISLTLPANAEGTLFVKVDDEDYKNATLVNGKASISLKDLAPGTHKLEVSYNGTDYEIESKTIDEFEVGIYVDYTSWPELNGNAWVYIKLPADVKGNITIDIGEFGQENVTPVNGIVNFTLPTSKFGYYVFTLSYTGDDYDIRFEEEDWEGNIEPIEYDVQIEPNFDIPEYVKGDNNKITFDVPADAKGKVSLYELDEWGEVIGFITSFNVTGPTVTVPLDMLKPGDEQKIGLVYEDEKYGTIEKDIGVDVANPTPTISISNTGDDKSAAFTFDMAPKNATGGLIVKIDGKSYFAPINDGVATLTVENLKAGNYNISVQYSGNENYSDAFAEKIVTIASSVPAKITAKDASVIYTAGTKYSVTVYAEGGQLAKGVEVVFKVNGKKVATVKTNDKGVATYNVVQVPGSYKITAEALGKTITKKLTVKHILKLQKVKVKRSAKKLVIKATLAKVNGKYLKGKKITLKFKGKKYTAKTNKKGVAKFTIKKNVLKKLKKGKKVTYQATYLKDTIKYSIKVKK